MPYRSYRRRYTPRRRIYRRRSYGRRRMYRQPRAERKYYQVTLHSILGGISSAWTENDLLGGIAQGLDSYSQRIGRSIKVHAVQVKGNLFGGAAGVGGIDDLYSNIRLCLLRFSAAKTASLTPLQTAGVQINSPLSHTVNPGLDHVYRDTTIPITNQPFGAGLAAAGHRAVNWYVKFRRPLHVNYTTASAQSNQVQLYLSAISDSTAVPHPAFEVGWVKVIYTDA